MIKNTHKKDEIFVYLIQEREFIRLYRNEQKDCDIEVRHKPRSEREQTEETRPLTVRYM